MILTFAHIISRDLQKECSKRNLHATGRQMFYATIFLEGQRLMATQRMWPSQTTCDGAKLSIRRKKSKGRKNFGLPNATEKVRRGKRHAKRREAQLRNLALSW